MAISQKLKKKILKDIYKLLKESRQFKRKRFVSTKWKKSNWRKSKSPLMSQREVNKLIRAIRSGVE